MIAASQSPNRILLLIIGTLMAAIGAAALAVHRGVSEGWAYFPSAEDELIAADQVPLWAPAAVIAASALLVLFGLWWAVRAVPRSKRARELQLHEGGRLGLTRMSTAALEHAVRDSAQQLRGVMGAAVRLAGTADHPHVTLKVEVDERVDIAAVADQIHGDVLEGLSTALEAPLNEVRLILDPVRGRSTSHAAAVSMEQRTLAA